MTGIISRLFCLFLKVSGTGSFPPPLSHAKERECFIKARGGDREAREALIEHNLRLVAHIVKKYYPTCRNQDDLVSIGTVGLIKAIDSFDITNGARFATYASRCLQNEILMYFRSQKKTACEVSINETIDIDKDGNPLTYIDVISCEDTIAEDIDLRLNSKKAIDLINTVLTDRERQIIVLRYGLNNRKPVTQREIAAAFGISRSYVSRIEKSAIDKLRDGFGDGADRLF
ncbi:MAG: RNA polymerase sporulation sigma factor SigK [Firmicutes bacterium]|uniref:RNA polymerase sigma factor n=1 Tax=Candidatus Colimorpha enterica TaxID=3083063 RepID=A0AAE3FFL5_9BACT|nr:RNA polymerase sporulation sigma factor SigK [Candidatus Colimorpha enterica]MCI5755456.1 RNA polymerase sporulation sigma factor SigK [Candidatus Colimorpha enterica]MDD6322130.1 RNA polymerase sporulation sigma factor SigK [Bacillota bacterium]MDY2906747.1 RNA polymerase sporulation sigma factor SigK [Eubacteriales bacterium]